VLSGQLEAQGDSTIVPLGEHNLRAEFAPSLRIVFTLVDGKPVSMLLKQGGGQFRERGVRSGAPLPGALVSTFSTFSPASSGIVTCSTESAANTAFCAGVAGASIDRRRDRRVRA
jgi:hypothetical protein